MNQAEQKVVSSLQALQQCLNEWSLGIKVHQGLMFDTATHMQRQGAADYLLREAVLDIMIDSDSTNGMVNRYPGVFSVPSSVIRLTEQLNEAKAFFQQAVSELVDAGYKPERVRSIYRLAGAPRLHALQAWRQIQIIEGDDLSSIGFTLAKHLNASYTLSAEDSYNALLSQNQPEIANMILEQGATSVRWHKPIAKHVKANIVWGAGETRATRLAYASLPFLIEGDTWPSKRVRFNQPRENSKRNDVRTANFIPLPHSAGSHITLF